jgi:hypothetical protein
VKHSASEFYFNDNIMKAKYSRITHTFAQIWNRIGDKIGC